MARQPVTLGPDEQRNAVPGRALFNVRNDGQLPDYGSLTIRDIEIENGENAGRVELVEFLGPSIDETDLGLYGGGSIDDTTDPYTFTPTITDVSRYGRSFQPGDLFQWNDSAVSDGRYAYEINQVLDITPEGVWTVRRSFEGDIYGSALFGSVVRAHTNKRFYPLLPRKFRFRPGPNGDATDAPLLSTRLSELEQWTWKGKCVAAVRSRARGRGGWGPPYIQNLAPDPTSTRLTPPSPGLRTLTGAAYTNLGRDGLLSVGQRERFPVSAQNWYIPRCLYCRVGTAPVGTTASFVGVLGTVTDAALVVYVLYIAPAQYGESEAQRTVAIVEQLAIGENRYDSWTSPNVPDGRQMPYGRAWPPSEVDVVGTLGTLALPLVLGGSKILIRPDGQYAFLVASVGTTTPGSNLIVTVQK